MGQRKAGVCRSVLFAAIVGFDGIAYGMTSVQTLEEKLVLEGESPDLILQLVEGYLMLEDFATAVLYFDYFVKSYPDYVDAERPKVMELQALLEAKQRLQKSVWQSRYQLGLGYDSNASQGTSLSQVDLRLGTGENLVLSVGPESKKQESVYTQAIGLFSRKLDSNRMIHASFDVVDYQNPAVKGLALGSVALSGENQMLGAYVFDKASTRFGAIYRGVLSDSRVSLQVGTEQRKISIDRLAFAERDSADIAAEFGAFASQDSASGWFGLRGQISLPVYHGRLRYVVELANADRPFDSVFFPGAEDRYIWQALRFALPLQSLNTEGWNLTLDYHQKKHDIEVNSWSGFDVKLGFSSTF